jgi:hypothetical protein
MGWSDAWDKKLIQDFFDSGDNSKMEAGCMDRRWMAVAQSVSCPILDFYVDIESYYIQNLLDYLNTDPKNSNWGARNILFYFNIIFIYLE